jgi:EpsI family protein
MRIGEWTGQEVPLDPAVKNRIDADAYVSRRYARQDGREAVALYLPCGTDVQALLQHVPENCYVGGGWTLVDRRPLKLRLASGQVLPCSIVQFARSGLDARKLLLLHFLIIDEEYFTTFSAVAKARGWRHFAGARYAAQVQIVTSAEGVSLDAVTKRVTDFARAAAPALEQFLRHIGVARTAGALEVDRESVR